MFAVSENIYSLVCSKIDLDGKALATSHMVYFYHCKFYVAIDESI